MKILYLAFTLLSVKFTLGQTPNWTSLKLFAGKATDYEGGIYIDKNNNYYLTGTLFSSSALGIDSLREGCKAIFSPALIGENGFLFRYDSNKILNLVLPFAPGAFGAPFDDDSCNIIVSGIFLIRKYFMDKAVAE